jgi:hypothetical protein
VPDGQGAAVSPGGVSKLRRRLDGESTLLYSGRADPRCVIEQHWADLCWTRAPIGALVPRAARPRSDCARRPAPGRAPWRRGQVIPGSFGFIAPNRPGAPLGRPLSRGPRCVQAGGMRMGQVACSRDPLLPPRSSRHIALFFLGSPPRIGGRSHPPKGSLGPCKSGRQPLPPGTCQYRGRRRTRGSSTLDSGPLCQRPGGLARPAGQRPARRADP